MNLGKIRRDMDCCQEMTDAGIITEADYCESCYGVGHLEVCIGCDLDGNEEWETQPCEECNYIRHMEL